MKAFSFFLLCLILWRPQIFASIDCQVSLTPHLGSIFIENMAIVYQGKTQSLAVGMDGYVFNSQFFEWPRHPRHRVRDFFNGYRDVQVNQNYSMFSVRNLFVDKGIFPGIPASGHWLHFDLTMVILTVEPIRLNERPVWLLSEGDTAEEFDKQIPKIVALIQAMANQEIVTPRSHIVWDSQVRSKFVLKE